MSFQRNYILEMFAFRWKSSNSINLSIDSWKVTEVHLRSHMVYASLWKFNNWGSGFLGIFCYLNVFGQSWWLWLSGIISKWKFVANCLCAPTDNSPQHLIHKRFLTFVTGSSLWTAVKCYISSSTRFKGSFSSCITERQTGSSIQLSDATQYCWRSKNNVYWIFS